MIRRAATVLLLVALALVSGLVARPAAVGGVGPAESWHAGGPVDTVLPSDTTVWRSLR